MRNRNSTLPTYAALLALACAAALLALWPGRGLLPAVLADSGGDVTTHTLTLEFQGSGSVNLDPPDEDFTDDTNQSYPEDEPVSLSATPSTGWMFERWEEDVTGTSPNKSVTMSSDKTARAVFSQPTLTVHKEGTGQVQVYVDGNPPGETLTPTFSKTYPLDTQVVLVAHAPAGWAFVEWTGDAGGTSETKQLTMSDDKTVTAVFEPIQITVNKDGEGTVNVTPPDTTDEPTFTVQFTGAAGSEEVTLTALPATGWAFKEWTGDLESENNPATMDVDGDKTVTAVFKEVELTVDREGEGDVHIDPPDITPEEYPHTEPYTSGTAPEVTLTATAAANWGFKEWAGDLTSTLATDTVTMDEPKSVTAVFEQVELTVNTTGEGSVSADPAGEEISPTTRGYAPGTAVELTAAPDPGWAFKEWTGAVTGTEPTVTTDPLEEDASVTAVFEQIELEVDTQGTGTINISPPNVTPEEESYPHTEVYAASTPENPQLVTLTAISGDNWGFKEWTGDVEPPVDTTTIDVEMDASKSVTAVFEQAVLTLGTEGEGSADASPAGEVLSPTTQGYAPGESVTLTATPAAGWGFKEWTGAITTADNPATVVMDGDQSVTAVFFQTTLSVTGEGQGKVKTTPYGDPAQTPPFTENFAPGEVVTLTADAEEGWAFTGWSGDVFGAAESIQVTMPSDPDGSLERSVKATFEQIQLTVDAVGQGTVTPPGGGVSYPHTITYTGAQNVSLTLTRPPAGASNSGPATPAARTRTRACSWTAKNP
jgi:uncharacterized repeat protein (TIGR02543 family)